MANRRGYKFFFDTETTGLSRLDDQILSAGFVVEDPYGNVVEEREVFIKLKHGILPSPTALAINKINPFSKKWKEKAVTENDFVKIFAEISQKYTTSDGVKPVMVNYNDPFDRNFVSVAVSRHGKRLVDYVSRAAVDPIKTVRNLIEKKILVTKMKKGRGNVEYMSASQTDVAEALGFNYEGEGAHSALSDARVMRQIYHKTFGMATGGLVPHEISTDPSLFKKGEVYSVISNSSSSGIKYRHILILENDPVKARLIALDEADIRENKGLKESSVRAFNYDTIVGEAKLDDQSEVSLQAYYKTQTEQIVNWAAGAKKKFKTKAEDEVFDEDTRNFDLISGVSDRMIKAGDKKSELQKCLNELLEKFNGDKTNARTVLTKAEHYAVGRGFEGWSKKLFPDRTITMLTHEDGDVTLRVSLHPSGKFKVGLDYPKDGDIYNLTEEVKDVKELAKLLDKYADSTPFKDFLSQLPSPKVFVDPKHPAELQKDAKKAMDMISSAKSPDKEKMSEAVLAAMILYKSESPLLFRGFKIDGHGDFDESYWKNDDSGSEDNSATQSKTIKKTVSEAMIATGSFPQDHAAEGEKVSKVPCALCGRALSASLSMKLSMGPTCRAKAELLDASQESPEVFASELVSLRDYSPRPGEVTALKFKKTNGSEKTVLSLVMEVNDDHVKVINRRELNKMLKQGLNPSMCVIMNTLKIKKDDVVGIGKISLDKIKQSEAA